MCSNPNISQDVAVDAAVGEFDELRARTRAEIETQHARAEFIKSAEVCTAASLGYYLGDILGDIPQARPAGSDGSRDAASTEDIRAELQQIDGRVAELQVRDLGEYLGESRL